MSDFVAENRVLVLTDMRGNRCLIRAEAIQTVKRLEANDGYPERTCITTIKPEDWLLVTETVEAITSRMQGRPEESPR